MGEIPDPFADARRDRGVLGLPTDKEVIPLILRHEDVRRAAKDWKTFSSDAPFRVPIPSEEALRSVRQLPIEADPPEQTDYRKLVEPFFLRAKQPAFVARVEAMTERLVAESLARDTIEAVGCFALPLQSRALTVLLDVPEAEAERFIGRVCPVDTDVHGMTVKAGDRASLCWASANLDETVFEAADEIRLGRRPNPHVAFGFGVHLCLGAAHARTVVRTLLEVLCRRVGRIDLVAKQERIEHTAAYDRPLGYESLTVRFRPR